MKYVFVIVAILVINYSAAFPQHGNRSDDKTLIVNEHGYNISASNKYSLLADSNQIRDSPGKQEGRDVGFVKNGPLNLTLYDELKFVLCDDLCAGKSLEICYDCHERGDSDSLNFCSSSQCFLKIHGDGGGLKENSKWSRDSTLLSMCREFSRSIKFIGSGRQGKPKIENGMIKMNIKSHSCPAKAKDAKIKYPEIPTTTVKPASTDDTASASLWSKWWFYVIIVFFLILILLIIGAPILYFYLDSRKKPSDPLRTAKSPAAAATKSTAAAVNTTQKTTEKNTAIEKSSIKKKTAAAAKTAKNNNTASSIKPSATLAGDTESRKMNLSHADKTMDGVESLAGNVTYEHS